MSLHQRSIRRAQSLRTTAVVVALALATGGVPAAAQVTADTISRISLSVGRSYPIQSDIAVTNIAVSNPDIADAVVVTERDFVINAKKPGETDIVTWSAQTSRRHYRVQVRSSSDRQMVMLSVRLAEVRRDVLREFGLSTLFKDQDGKVRVGTGRFRNDAVFDQGGAVKLPTDARFLTILSNLGSEEFLGLLEAEEKKGRARLLAEPNLLTGNLDSASFLAGGEIPIPVATPGVGGFAYVTIEYREFGIRLLFVPEILDDSLVKLWVRPEVSSLDYANAITISGFSVPALRTRRVESTVDIGANQSVIISGLFAEEREQVKTGIPLLMDIPILGHLFSSTRWQANESELLVVVTPMVINPSNLDPSLRLPLLRDARIPANEALEKRLPPKPPLR